MADPSATLPGGKARVSRAIESRKIEETADRGRTFK
jgi:hypothetical protein